MRKNTQSMQSSWMNGVLEIQKTGPSFDAKLTVLSSLAAIQIELTVVMHWKGIVDVGERPMIVIVVTRVTVVETIHSISGSIGFKS